MSEALRKYIIKQAKDAKAFDKKFRGERGLPALVDTLDGAPPDAQNAGIQLLRDNSSDLEAAANKLRDMVYGPAEPVKKTGVRGKSSEPAERIEGNLPNNASDKGTLPDPPKTKKGSAARKPAPAGKQQTPAAKSKPAPSQPAPEEAVPEEAAVDEDVTEIGQFMPAANFGGVEVAGSFLPGVFDPRVELELGGAAPDFSVTTDPASLRRANPMDMSLLARSQFDTPVDTGTPPPVEPKVDPFALPENPADLGAMDMSWMQPQATPGVSMQALAGLMDPLQSAPDMPVPSVTPDAPAPTPDALGPQSPMDMSLLSPGAGDPMDMGRMADPAFRYSPPAEAPPKTRPPFYDPNVGAKGYFREPGLVSRANEFLYQRGMPASVARAIRPTAATLDFATKVLAPLGVAAGVGYGGLKGLQALSSGGATSTGGPPTDEEQAILEERAKRSMGELQQILGGRNPASAPTSTPVQ